MLKQRLPIVALFIAAAYWGLQVAPNVVFLALLACGLVAIYWVLNHWSYAQVPELEVGVIYNTRKQQFSRFLPTGRHRLTPFAEKLQATIPLTSVSASDKTVGVQTIGGISLDLSWAVSYTLNPFRVEAQKQAKLARTLPTKSKNAITKHMHNVMQHVLGDYSVEEIVQPGMHKKLEREVRDMISERLFASGFEVARVMIGAITLPPQVKKALEAAEERRVQAENEARTLERLQSVISHFSDADVQRLIELERIHTLGQNGVALFYPTVEGNLRPAQELPLRHAQPIPNAQGSPYPTAPISFS
ncbi:MAG: SPFH domain-containing protein [Chloroflexota bacterium]